MELDHSIQTPESGMAPLSRSRREKAARLLKTGFQRIPLRRLTFWGVLGFAIYGIGTHPPIKPVQNGEVGLRTNQFTGSFTRFQDGMVTVIPFIHKFQTYSLRDRVYQPKNDDAGGGFSFQSTEGLTLGADFTVRYALDIDRLPAMARNLPDDIDNEIVLPVIQGVLYKTFSRYTVREIFSSHRQEIQDEIVKELQVRLIEDGIKLKSLTLGKIMLPPEVGFLATSKCSSPAKW